MRATFLVLCISSASLSAYTKKTDTENIRPPTPVVMPQNTGNVGQQPEQVPTVARPFAAITRAIIESILYCQRY